MQQFSRFYRGADVIPIMPYPDLREGPLNDVCFMMLRSRELMKIVGRQLPQLVILQTWVLSPEGKLPEIPELRVMAYQAMLGGAKTLSFFHYNVDVWSRTPCFHQGFVCLMYQLKVLSCCYADALIESTMMDSGVLQAQFSMPGEPVRMLRVNTKRSSAAGLEPLEIVESTISNCSTVTG